MPYQNMPKSMWDEMEKCVADVKKKNRGIKSPYAICYNSIMGKRKKKK